MRYLILLTITLMLGGCALRSIQTPSGYRASERVFLARSSLRVTTGTLTISYGAQSDLEGLGPALEALARGAMKGAKP